jgi:hypothetical protein
LFGSREEQEGEKIAGLGLETDRALIYLLTVLAARLGPLSKPKGGDGDFGMFDRDMKFLSEVDGKSGAEVVYHSKVPGKTYQRMNNKNASDYAGDEYRGFKTGHTKDPVRNAFEVKDGSANQTGQEEKEMDEAVKKIHAMWAAMKEESEKDDGKFQVIGVKNNFMMQVEQVEKQYEGMHQILVSLVYTPQKETGGTKDGKKIFKPLTFEDIFVDFDDVKKGDESLLDKAFAKARDVNTSEHGGKYLAEGSKYDAMQKTLKDLYKDFVKRKDHFKQQNEFFEEKRDFEKIRAMIKGRTVPDHWKTNTKYKQFLANEKYEQKLKAEGRRMQDKETWKPHEKAFFILMKTPFTLICETQIHLEWYFTRRKLTHLWFKANRAKSLSMLKYDSYGWKDRPNGKDFEKMLKRQTDWDEEVEDKRKHTITNTGAASKKVPTGTGFGSLNGRADVIASNPAYLQNNVNDSSSSDDLFGFQEGPDGGSAGGGGMELEEDFDDLFN